MPFRRMHTNHQHINTSIVIEFNKATEKNNLLRSIRHRWTVRKQNLCLHDVKLNSDSRIYVNESLTTSNHMILRKALVLKRGKVLSSVFTRSGRVYVRVTGTVKTLLITSMENLDTIIADPTTNES